MRVSLSANELLSAVLLPSVLLTALLVGLAFMSWKLETDRREAPLRREIAQNFAQKWGRCDLVAKWDSAVPCEAR